MTPDELAHEVGVAIAGLELAAQGAFSSAGVASPLGSSRIALSRYLVASEAAMASIRALIQLYALQLGPTEDESSDVLVEADEALDDIRGVVMQLQQQVARAIKIGSGTPAAAMLKSAHGAVGQIVGQQTQTLTLVVRDSSGRAWKSPQRLASTIARGYAVQAGVIVKLGELHRAGHAMAMVGEDSFPLDEIAHMRAVLFHPNSKDLPRAESEIHP